MNDRVKNADEGIREAEIVTEPKAMALVREASGENSVANQVQAAQDRPRSITKFRKDVLSLVTLDQPIAEQCFYKLRRSGKPIEGPSVRFAEIVAGAYGNLRIEAKPIAEDAKFVTSRGVAWDVEKNVAIAFEVTRRITTSEGQRYSDDMIGVTKNAASAIALRNSILRVVPRALWEDIYEKAKETAVGTSETLADRRVKILQFFVTKHNVAADKVFAYLGVHGENDIGLEQLEELRGLANALKDGEISLDEAFAEAAASGDKAQASTARGAAGAKERLKAKREGTSQSSVTITGQGKVDVVEKDLGPKPATTATQAPAPEANGQGGAPSTPPASSTAPAPAGEVATSAWDV